VTFFATNAETIPLQLSYKDADGNVYNSVQDVKISATNTTAQKGTGLPMTPIIAAIVIIAVFIGGWFVYLRKTKK
jgi:hypothetical protein